MLGALRGYLSSTIGLNASKWSKRLTHFCKITFALKFGRSSLEKLEDINYSLRNSNRLVVFPDHFNILTLYMVNFRVQA